MTKEPREHLHGKLIFFLFTLFSIHDLFIPRCMLMFNVGKGSPGLLSLEDTKV